jgi:hypothetical protein
MGRYYCYCCHQYHYHYYYYYHHHSLLQVITSFRGVNVSILAHVDTERG